MQQHGMKFVKMKIPCLFMIVTWLPVLLVACMVPSSADTQFYQSVENIIDQYFFGEVGMWSSTFPLVSKVISNYICLAAPIYSVIFTYITMKKSIIKRTDNSDCSLQKLITLFVSFMGFMVFFFYAVFVGDTDLANVGTRYSFFGGFRFTYALFSVGTLFLVYMMAVCTYISLRFLLVVIIYRVCVVK